MACAAEKGKSLKIVCMARPIVPPGGRGSQGGGWSGQSKPCPCRALPSETSPCPSPSRRPGEGDSVEAVVLVGGIISLIGRTRRIGQMASFTPASYRHHRPARSPSPGRGEGDGHGEVSGPTAHPGGHPRHPARTLWKPFTKNPLQTFESPAWNSKFLIAAGWIAENP